VRYDLITKEDRSEENNLLSNPVGKRFVQGIYFTLFSLGIWVYLLWSRHRRRMFWASLAVLLLLHLAGALFFTLRFRPLLVWEWTLLGIVDSYLVGAVVYWSTRHSDHVHRL
jgi:hypothetical protein